MNDNAVASQVDDLTDLSLDELAASGGGVDKALARIMPDKDDRRVPVAAFNSSI